MSIFFMQIRKRSMSRYFLCQLEKNIPGLSATQSVWVTDSASAVRVGDSFPSSSFPLGDLLDSESGMPMT